MNGGFSRRYRGWMLFVLMAMNALNLADRQGLAAVAPVLKRDLQLSDTELGLVQGLGFAIFYTLLGLPIARLAERYSRARIIAGSIFVFSAFIALVSQARSFGLLLICRIGVGAGDAGFGPPVASLIGDHYPAGKRASAMTLVWLGAPIGALIGAGLGGWTAQHVDWRWWFIGLAIPGVLTAALAFLTLREPRRGLFDEVAHGGAAAIPSIGAVLRFLLGKPSMRHVLFGAGLAAIGLNGMGQFWGRFLVAVFHIGTAQAGLSLGLLAVVSMASGFVLGGFGVDWAGRHDQRWYVWGPAIALAGASPLFLLGIAQPDLTQALIVLLPAHVLLFVFYTPSLAIAQNMVGASMRASSAFVMSIVLGLVGTGFGPTLVGLISDTAAQHFFGAGDFAALCRGGSAGQMADACASASAEGITVAIGTVALLPLWASLHFLLASRHLRADLMTKYDGQPKPGR